MLNVGVDQWFFVPALKAEFLLACKSCDGEEDVYSIMAIMPLFSTTLGIASDLWIFFGYGLGRIQEIDLAVLIVEVILPPFKPATMSVTGWTRSKLRSIGIQSR